MAYLYRHIRIDKNEPFYIGIGNDSDGEYKRANQVTGRNKYWKNIVDITEYKVEIIFDDIDWEYACEKEKEFISLYGRKDLCNGVLCNMTDGGEGTLGIFVSEETRKKMSETRKEKYKKGELNPKAFAFKKGHTTWNKGLKMSEDFCRKISKLKKGIKYSKKIREKLSELRKGHGNGFFNKIHSDSSKRQMSESIKNKYKNGHINGASKMVIDLETGFFYSSGKEAYTLNKSYFKVAYFTFLKKLKGDIINNTKFRQVDKIK